MERIDDLKLLLDKDFNERLSIMLNSNQFACQDITRAFIIILKNGVSEFIDKVSLTKEQYDLIEDKTNLFNDFLNHIEFTKPFGLGWEWPQFIRD